MPYLLALDIGTSSTKACAFAENGELLYRKRIDYPIHSPQPGYQEQDPDEIVQAVETAVKEVVQMQQEQPLCLVFSCAMHSLIAVDKAGKPLTNSIIWADNRSAAYANSLRGTAVGKEIYRHTGTPIHPMSPLCKIAWLRDEQPDIFQRTHKFISIKEYLLWQWFGEYVVDYSIASATGLFDIQQLEWFAPALGFAGINAQQLSKAVPPEHILTAWKNGRAERLGLQPNTAVVPGASDGCLANLGEQVTAAGEVVISLGTSGAIRTISPIIRYDEQERIFNYILTKGSYVAGGPTNNGGIVFLWFSKILNEPIAELEKLEVEAARLPPGANGLFFLPYLLGERAPIWTANAKGAFLGLTLQHTRIHLLRALMEGVLYNLFHIAESLQQVEGTIQRIYANGGFTQSEVALQILADVFGVPVHVQEHEESAAWGAAILGIKAIRKLDTWPELPRLETGQIFRPQPAHHQQYQTLFRQYRELSAVIVPELEKIAILDV